MVNNKNKSGRPKIIIPRQRQPEFSECLICYRVYDRNMTTFQQKLIEVQDKDFCPNCFNNEIMCKDYQQQQDDIIYDFWRSNKITYGNMIKKR
jgi:hypothetical protein